MKKRNNEYEEDFCMRQITQYNLENVWLIRESIAKLAKLGIYSFSIDVLKNWIFEIHKKEIDINEVAQILSFLADTDKIITMKIWFEDDEKKPIIVDVINQIPKNIPFDKCYPIFFITEEYKKYSSIYK